jgi:hypothetical protein
MSEDQAEGFLAGPHLSGGKAGRLSEAPEYWLSRLLDALVAIRRRAQRGDKCRLIRTETR